MVSPRAWLALGAAGAAVGGFGAGAAAAATQAPAAVAVAYVDKAACGGCPAGRSLDSIEVQARDGSTLFVVRGTWPASVDGLRDNVRLLAGTTEIVLKPHGSLGAFEMVAANRAGAAMAEAAVAASLVDGALVINVKPALATPLTFEFGFWSGSAYAGRIPRSGTLTWDGKAAPIPTQSTATTTTTTTSTTSIAAPVPSATTAATSLAAACGAIPSASSVPPYLALTQLSSSPATPDPRTNAPARKLTAGTSASLLDVTAPFAVVAVIAPAGSKPPTGQSRAIDRAGTVQLYVYSDGTVKHKVIRTFVGGRWTEAVDAAAADLTFAIKTSDVSFYWPGLKAGDLFGFITAAPGAACASSGLDQQLRPNTTAS